jgi:hypothetical protein
MLAGIYLSCGPIGSPRGLFQLASWRRATRPRLSFPQPAVLRLLLTRETIAQQYARWHRPIPLLDGAPCDRAYVAAAGLHTFVRTQQRHQACAQ